MRAAVDAERESHRAALAAASMFGGGVDREDIVGIARTLQDLAGSLEEAAYAMSQVSRRAAPWDALAGVIRDGVREIAAAIDHLDGTGADCHAHLDRADELYAEWRNVVRPARARALGQGAEPRAAVGVDIALTRLERAQAACRGAGRAVRTVALKHA